MQDLYFLTHKFMLAISSLAIQWKDTYYWIYYVPCNITYCTYVCMNSRGYKVEMRATDSKFCRRAENFWMTYNHIYWIQPYLCRGHRGEGPDGVSLYVSLSFIKILKNIHSFSKNICIFYFETITDLQENFKYSINTISSPSTSWVLVGDLLPDHFWIFSRI